MNHFCCSSKYFNFLLKPLTREIKFNAKFVNRQCLVIQAFCFSSTSNLLNQMKRWQTEGFTGIDGLHISSTDVPPVLSPSDILIKVSAASMNPIDLAMIGGYGKDVMKTLRKLNQLSSGKISCDDPAIFPLTVGRDFAGEVVHVGQNVTNVSLNDKVWGTTSPQRQGSHAEYVVVNSSCVNAKPANLSDIEAASMPYVALTCWSAAVFSGGMKPKNCYDSKVLILGASGGIGSFMTQLLTSWGAEVTGVCSASAFELVISCGAQEVFDYKDPQTKVELTSYPRFDLVIDASGLIDSKWTDSLKEWNNSSYVTLSSPLLRNIDQSGICQGLFKSLGQVFNQNFLSVPKGRSVKWAFFMPNPHALAEVTKMVMSEQIKPYVDKVFSFDDGMEAYLYAQNGEARGKTVIYMNSEESVAPNNGR